jgi:hypothetical protein
MDFRIKKTLTRSKLLSSIIKEAPMARELRACPDPGPSPKIFLSDPGRSLVLTRPVLILA